MTDLTPLQSGEHALVSADSTAAQSMSSREVAAIQSAIIQAKRFPRNEDAAFAAAISMSKRPSFAKEAIYKRPQGDGQVTGPSVRLVRALVRAWGNVRVSMQVIPDVPGWCTVEVTAIDLETNIHRSEQTRFKMEVFRKKHGGTINLETSTAGFAEQEIRSLLARRSAFPERAACLKLLPPDLIEDTMDACRKTSSLSAAEALKADPINTRKKLVGAFAELGVTVAMLETYLGHPLSELGPEELADLTAVGKSIKDGESNRLDHFVSAKQVSGIDSVTAAMESAMDTAPAKGKASKPPASSKPDVEQQAFERAAMNARKAMEAMGGASTDDPA